MTLGAFEESLRASAGDGAGANFYDFETMYTLVEHYPFDGSVSDLVLPFVTARYFHEIIHYFQHVGTTVGMFQAQCRQNRLRYFRDGVDHANPAALSARIQSPEGRRRPLITRGEFRSILGSDHDPISPHIGYPFRKHWLQALFGEKNLLTASVKGLGKSTVENVAMAMLHNDAMWHGLINNAPPDPGFGEFLRGIVSKGLTTYQYRDGDVKWNLDTIHIIENFCSVWEIGLLYQLMPDLAQFRVAQADRSSYLTATRLILWRFGKDFMPRNISDYAPEIMLLSELSLNPPLSWFDSESADLSWEDIYPPSRLTKLVDAALKIGGHATVDGYGGWSIKERMKELIDASGLPMGDVRLRRSNIGTGLERFLDNPEASTDEHLAARRTWFDYYLLFQHVTLDHAMSGRSSITEFLYQDLLRSEFRETNLYWSPPKVNTVAQEHLTANYMGRNQILNTFFAWENLSTYLSHNVMLGAGAFAALPFGIPSAQIEAWKLLGLDQLRETLAKQLHVPASSVLFS